jgi:hypothetical protein
LGLPGLAEEGHDHGEQAPSAAEGPDDPGPHPVNSEHSPHWHSLEVKALEGEIRAELRRLARTSDDPHHRRRALVILTKRDPGVATAHICDRLLRLDGSPGVKVAAAACLGRQKERVSAAHLPTLVAALGDDRDVVQIAAGEAIAKVGDWAAINALSASAKKTTGTTAISLDQAAARGRKRLERAVAFRAQEEANALAPIALPAAATLIPAKAVMNRTLSAMWLGVYGGSVGWLSGGLAPILLGQGDFLEAGPFYSVAGGTLGIVAGATYGALVAPEFRQAHTVVQLGTLGTLLGAGAGFLTAAPGSGGSGLALGSLLGTLAGTGTGVVLAQVATPTPGALALGTAVAGGAGLSFVALGGSLGFRSTPAFALAAMGTGLTGTVATLAASPYDVGLFPILGATLGGGTLATLAGFGVGLVESIQGVQPTAAGREGRGWAVFGGYLVGAALGGVGASFIPNKWDPFVDLDIQPATSALPPTAQSSGQAAVLTWGLSGRFHGVAIP